jgi:hypothetical protein
MPKKKKTEKKGPKTRPPCVYREKSTGRYFIKVNGKKVYFPKNMTAQNAIQKSLKKMRVRRQSRKPDNRLHEASVDDSRMLVNYRTSHDKVLEEYMRKKKMEDIALAQKKAAENQAEEEKKQALAGEKAVAAEAKQAETKAKEEGTKAATLAGQLAEQALSQAAGEDVFGGPTKADDDQREPSAVPAVAPGDADMPPLEAPEPAPDVGIVRRIVNLVTPRKPDPGPRVKEEKKSEEPGPRQPNFEYAGAPAAEEAVVSREIDGINVGSRWKDADVPRLKAVIQAFRG